MKKKSDKKSILFDLLTVAMVLSKLSKVSNRSPNTVTDYALRRRKTNAASTAQYAQSKQLVNRNSCVLPVFAKSHEVFQFPTEEPITGETLHKAIILDRRADVEKILETSEGKRVLEIPDKFGNLPLMIAVNRNNLE